MEGVYAIKFQKFESEKVIHNTRKNGISDTKLLMISKVVKVTTY